MSQKIQMCSICGCPTDRCEDDSLLDSNGNPLCEQCWDVPTDFYGNIVKEEEDG